MNHPEKNTAKSVQNRETSRRPATVPGRATSPVRLKAWDGSTAGPVDAPLVVLGNSVDAVRRLLWRRGELGAAQAYVSGEIDVPGDLDHALTHAFAVAKERGLCGMVRPYDSAAVVREPWRDLAAR